MPSFGEILPSLPSLGEILPSLPSIDPSMIGELMMF
jgi:hypothetical protein